jgi:hypothetical protein
MRADRLKARLSGETVRGFGWLWPVIEKLGTMGEYGTPNIDIEQASSRSHTADARAAGSFWTTGT